MTYTEAEIDKLVAGQELDRAIQVAVFKTLPEHLEYLTVLPYSADVRWAFHLFEMLISHASQNVNIPTGEEKITHLNGTWVVNFRGYSGASRSICVAICKMALLYSKHITL